MNKSDFKKSMEIFAKEFNKYFSLGGQGYCPDVNYKGKAVGELLKKQMNGDYKSIVNFINSRLDDGVIDLMEKEGAFKDA